MFDSMSLEESIPIILAAASHVPRLADDFDSFITSEAIARGKFGEVFRASCQDQPPFPALEEPFVIKYYRPQSLEQRSFVEFFARSLTFSALPVFTEHPEQFTLPLAHFYNEEQNRLGFIYPYQGISLRAYVAELRREKSDNTKLEPKTLHGLVSKIFPRILENYALLHDAGILHRDANPDNILLMPDASRITLCDFDIAGYKEKDDLTSTIVQERLTFFGNPSYLPRKILERVLPFDQATERELDNHSLSRSGLELFFDVKLEKSGDDFRSWPLEKIEREYRGTQLSSLVQLLAHGAAEDGGFSTIQEFQEGLTGVLNGRGKRVRKQPEIQKSWETYVEPTHPIRDFVNRKRGLIAAGIFGVSALLTGIGTYRYHNTLPYLAQQVVSEDFSQESLDRLIERIDRLSKRQIDNAYDSQKDKLADFFVGSFDKMNKRTLNVDGSQGESAYVLSYLNSAWQLTNNTHYLQLFSLYADQQQPSGNDGSFYLVGRFWPAFEIQIAPILSPDDAKRISQHHERALEALTKAFTLYDEQLGVFRTPTNPPTLTPVTGRFLVPFLVKAAHDDAFEKTLSKSNLFNHELQGEICNYYDLLGRWGENQIRFLSDSQGRVHYLATFGDSQQPKYTERIIKEKTGEIEAIFSQDQVDVIYTTALLINFFRTETNVCEGLPDYANLLEKNVNPLIQYFDDHLTLEGLPPFSLESINGTPLPSRALEPHLYSAVLRAASFGLLGRGEEQKAALRQILTYNHFNDGILGSPYQTGILGRSPLDARLEYYGTSVAADDAFLQNLKELKKVYSRDNMGRRR